MSQKYTFSDEVWHRVVQIVQEAMIMGVDCVDLLRQIKVQTDPENGNLVLTPEYVKQVNHMHEKWLEEAEKIKITNNDNLLFPISDDTTN